jgi:hypothetical protein
MIAGIPAKKALFLLLSGNLDCQLFFPGLHRSGQSNQPFFKCQTGVQSDAEPCKNAFREKAVNKPSAPKWHTFHYLISLVPTAGVRTLMSPPTG